MRVNSQRAKLKPNKGGMGIMDIIPFWMAAKIGWLRKLLQKDYNEERKLTIYIISQQTITLTKIQKQRTG